MNFVVITEFCSNSIYRIVMKFGDYNKIQSCSLDYEKIKGITMKSYSQKKLDSRDSFDSVEDPITIAEVLGTTSLAGEEAVAVTFLFDVFLKFCLSFSFPVPPTFVSL